jgi:hypothetical protein
MVDVHLSFARESVFAAELVMPHPAPSTGEQPGRRLASGLSPRSTSFKAPLVSHTRSRHDLTLCSVTAYLA